MASALEKYYEYKEKYPALFALDQPDDLSMAGDPSQSRADELGVIEEHAGWLWVRELSGNRPAERPVYLNEAIKKQIEGYFSLVEKRPDLFVQSDKLPICLDRHLMLRFMEQTGRPVGLVFDNGKYYKVVADLIGTPSPFAYARVIYPDTKGNGTVIIPRMARGSESPLFGILHIFRHSIRQMSGGEFPRGFQEPDISAIENAKKELWEEFCVPPESIEKVSLLGSSRADTGLCSGFAQIYLVDIHEYPRQANVGHEGIMGFEWVSEEELLKRIKEGVILDGMTQCAMLLYMVNADC